MRTVFIGYAPDDSTICEHFVNSLRERGFRVIYEKPTMICEEPTLSPTVLQKLLACSAFILLLSPSSVACEYVLSQASTYVTMVQTDASRLFLPVLIQPCTIPETLSGVIWSTIVHRPIDMTIEDLIRVLNASPKASRVRRRVLLAAVGSLLVVGGLSWMMIKTRSSVPETPTEPMAKIPTRYVEYRGHNDAVYAVAWSPPDGKRIVSASADTTVQVWDATSGKTLQIYRGHTGQVYGVDWSPDGKYIVSGSDDHTAQVWEASTGQHLVTYSQHTNGINTVAWSPDGASIASCSNDSTVQIWEARTGKRLINYTNHKAGVNTIAWSPDKRFLASGGNDGTMQVWEATTGKTLFSKSVDNYHVVYIVVWSPDGKRLASDGSTGVAWLWDTATGNWLGSGPISPDAVYGLAWSPDGRRIVSGSKQGTAVIWDAYSADVIATYSIHTDTIHALKWSFDGTRVVSASMDKTVQVWEGR